MSDPVDLNAYIPESAAGDDVLAIRSVTSIDGWNRYTNLCFKPMPIDETFHLRAKGAFVPDPVKRATWKQAQPVWQGSSESHWCGDACPWSAQ